MEVVEETDIARRLAAEFAEIARRAETEEDLRLGVEEQLRPACRELGIDVAPQYEKTLLDGSADALYGHAVIEYERPGKIMTEPGYAETTGQLRRYLFSRASELNSARPQDELESMVGISFDGEHFIFCQYRKLTAAEGIEYLPREQLTLDTEQELREGFDISQRIPVTPESVSLFLSVLRSMSRPPLTAGELAVQFGPDGDIARQLVPVLYDRIQADEVERTRIFKAEWQRLFGIVYGGDVGRVGGGARELAALYGIADPEPDFFSLMFAIHTYFATVMKLLAIELLALQKGALVDRFVKQLAGVPNEELRDAMQQLEFGELFAKHGIANFVEGDFFQWYVHDWTVEIADGMRGLAGRLDQYEPSAALMQPEKAEDLLKELYQRLVPKKLRHDLGEYYTPDWLAEHLIERSGFSGAPGERMLDPSCGSGTFLVNSIRRVRRACLDAQMSQADSARAVLDQVVGFEINPLAVIAARTNYILALGDLVRHVQPLDLPVYFCDSILTPDREATEAQEKIFGDDTLRDVFTYRAVVGDLPIPAEAVGKGVMPRLAGEIEDGIATRADAEAFAPGAMRNLGLEEENTEEALKALYSAILDLHKQGVDGIWARTLANAVAPLGVGRFDYVIGNPPWIQWEDLDPAYRAATAGLWERYGLTWERAGLRAGGLGSTKRDLSMLFAYACAGRYLKPDGTLAFLITQTVFQTDAGSLFRQFRTPDGDVYRVGRVDDYSDLQPFDATNWSSSFVWKRSEPSAYPVEYTVWQRKGRTRPKQDFKLSEAKALTERAELAAEPLDRGIPTSRWMLAPEGIHAHLRKLSGETVTYAARAGIVTWLDGCFWMRIVDEREDGLVVVENIADGGKTRLKQYSRAIEPDLLVPYVGRTSVKRWNPSVDHAILVPHTRETGAEAIPEDEMRERYPATLRYLHLFREQLVKRSGYRQLFKGKGPFYACSNVGGPWHSPYKVVWSAMGKSVDASVFRPVDWIGGTQRAPIHKNTSSYVAVDTEAEAFYLAGMLNSSFVTAYARSTSVRGGKGFASTGLLQNVVVPRFDARSAARVAVAEYAKQVAEAAEGEDVAKLDELVAEVWGIGKRAFAGIAEVSELLS